MKTILKSEFNDKPFYLRFCPYISEIMGKYSIDLPQTDYGNIYLTIGQKERLSTRARTHIITTYLPIEIVKYLLNDYIDNLQHFAFCTHDKDIYTDDILDEQGNILHTVGEIKKIHTHLIIVYEQPTLYSQSAFYFHTLEITNNDKFSLKNRWEYLIHNTNECKKKNKHLYNESERFCDDIEYFKSRCTDDDQNEKNLVWVNMINDVVSGLSTKLLVQKYGANFIRYRKNIYETAFAIIEEDEKLRKLNANYRIIDDGEYIKCYTKDKGILIKNMRKVDLYEL